MAKHLNFKQLSVHEAPERSPGFLLWHISTSWRTAIEKVLKLMHITHPQFVVMATLGWLTKDGARVTQAAIGKMAGLDPNTTSQIIKGLENKELIRREQSIDGRAKNPVLTPTGNMVLMKALPAVEAADAEFFAGLKLKEMEHLLGMFQKLTRKKQ